MQSEGLQRKSGVKRTGGYLEKNSSAPSHYSGPTALP